MKAENLFLLGFFTKKVQKKGYENYQIGYVSALGGHWNGGVGSAVTVIRVQSRL